MERRTYDDNAKPISTYAHGVFDYIGGIALLLAPNIFGFSEYGGPAVWIPRLIGLGVLVQSMLTAYELGVVRVIPMRIHLMNDYVIGVFLAASPWLFGFKNLPANAWAPHLIVGIAVLAVSLMTEKYPRLAGPTHGAV